MVTLRQLPYIDDLQGLEEAMMKGAKQPTKCHIQNNEDMKCKFENSVNAILFLMFSSVLVTISFSNCMGGCHDSNDNSNLKQTGMDTINIDSVHN